MIEVSGPHRQASAQGGVADERRQVGDAERAVGPGQQRWEVHVADPEGGDEGRTVIGQLRVSGDGQGERRIDRVGDQPVGEPRRVGRPDRLLRVLGDLPVGGRQLAVHRQHDVHADVEPSLQPAHVGEAHQRRVVEVAVADPGGPQQQVELPRLPRGVPPEAEEAVDAVQLGGSEVDDASARSGCRCRPAVG